MNLIVVTGMPGAGKSEIAKAASDLDVPVIVMGDIIREITCRKGLKPTPTNTRITMLEIREKEGPGAVAKYCIDAILKLNNDVILIEGCRSLAEIDVFQSYCDNLKIVCVHASPNTRFNRLQERKRDDAPTDWESFKERDIRELSVGLGGVIAMSDIMLVNELSLEKFQIICTNTIKELL
ncbi:MAG: flagellar hook-basal body complex protein FliE [Candidatus Lokiarchaeota archaeon]|nr:flagellar hook-basal body complex protein FliE [Candidatus Lokiarchaeota archaeon]